MPNYNRRRSVGRPAADPESEQKIHESIMAACLKAVGVSGPQKFTIKEVAHMAGVSPASIYYYFGDKENLQYETLNHFFQPLYKRTNELLTDCESPMELLVKLFINILEATLAQPDLLPMFVLDFFKVPGVSFQELNNYYPPPNTGAMIAILRKGQEDGILRPGIMCELVYVTLLSLALMGPGSIGKAEQTLGEKVDPMKARDHFLYLFCLSMEGPKCNYDWRSIHFPRGVPGES
ncbi:MAG: TetR/AcrR family transcriptional regulator [Deltaproteobacteria bacterium]|jgi:AcrR family transcriptional regulator|nr:TetR/AcrR family transcriptional regulator [Deltaproteobacteria bacterium]